MEEIVLRDVKWHPKTNKLCQVPKEGLEYALVSEDYQQIHQLVWCKDFIQDAIYASLHKKNIEIYGFTYEPETSPPVDLKKTRLLITNYKDKEFGTRLQTNCLSLLHHVEDRLGMTRTYVEKCAKAPPAYRNSGVWILNSSKRYMKAPVMVSFYTFIMRLGFIHTPGDTLEQTLEKLTSGQIEPYYDKDKGPRREARDKEIAKEGRKAIDAIMKYGDQRLFPADLLKNYPAKTKSLFGDKEYDFSIYTIHDGCGLTAYAKGRTRTYFPLWHKVKGAPQGDLS